MPGLQLYQTEADELVLVKAALDQGCWLVPDLNYETDEVQRFRSTEEYQHFRTEERHFFVLSEAFVRAPLSLRKITKADRILFYVSPSEGGPFLEFLGGGSFVDDSTGGRRIRPGFFTFSRRYWAADLSRTYDSPVELEEMFKRLTRVVKASSTRIKPGKSAFWLGNDARAQMADGVRLVCYESWSLDSGPSNTCRLNAAT
ncbi:MAG: hypothetical protein ABR987_16940 [Terracidiphilus sp.]